MRIWDETSHDTEYCEGLNLQVSRPWGAVLFVQGNQAVILLVHIQILYHAPPEQFRKTPLLALDLKGYTRGGLHR